jgi:hypothetical protein
MDTRDLIRTLSADRGTARSRWGMAARLGLAAASATLAVIAVVVFGFGLRPDLGGALASRAGIAKFALAALLAAAAWAGLPRAAEPGRPAPLTAAGAGLAVLLGGGVAWASLDTGEAWAGDPLGCVLSILGLSILPLGAILLALRQGAPTRPSATGAVAGIAAGGIAAFGFGLSCPMDIGPYVAVWYPLAVALCGLLGALAARRALAW